MSSNPYVHIDNGGGNINNGRLGLRGLHAAAWLHR